MKKNNNPLKMVKFIFYLFVALDTVSCQYSAEIERALQLSNNNRQELEKVLSYYSQHKVDSLKLKAACFLIENMPYHSYYESKQMDNYSHIYEALIKKQDVFFVLDSFQTKYGSFERRDLTRKYDILELKSDYIIQNIDWAFKVWNEQPWGKSVSFDDFCNYILPYRVNVEQPVEWRKYLFEKYNPLLDNLRKTNEGADPILAAQTIIDVLCREEKFFTAETDFIPLVNPLLLDIHRAGSCRNMADLTVYILRSLGIPCGIEYMPIHGRVNGSHCWTFILDKNRKTYTSDYLNCTILPARKTLHCTAKIFRETFAINKKIQKELSGVRKTTIAPLLINPRFIDVTDQYTIPLSVHIPQSEYISNKKPPVVYLCAAKYQNWVPIAWSFMKGDQIVFDNIKLVYAETDTLMDGLTRYTVNLIPEKVKEYMEDIVFKVACLENDQLHFMTQPFICRKNGTVDFLRPAKDKNTICVFSKFNPLSDAFVQFMPGSVFEASNDSRFNHVDTLCVVRKVPMRLFNTEWINSNKTYRYVRYKGADNSACSISEIWIFGDTDSVALKGKPFGSIDGMEIEKHGYANAFDEDPYTSFYSPNPNGDWVGIDFGKAVKISRIIYTPRNRDNFVRIGDNYELFYLEEDEWRSLGDKMAESDSLLFENAPSNTLFYLKNHTRGKDERIFIYEDNVQVFF